MGQRNRMSLVVRIHSLSPEERQQRAVALLAEAMLRQAQVEAQQKKNLRKQAS
jgi:hypothetical protein